MEVFSSNGISHLISVIKNALSGKVDKETGKGLSTNDYTDAEKTKLTGLDGSLYAPKENPVFTGTLSSSSANISQELGSGAISMGSGTTATGQNSIALGAGTTATGTFSVASGVLSTASGNMSHAENYQSTASGQNSHAECYHTVSSGANSHAEGYYTESSGANSHAEGFWAESSGDSSHAEGAGGSYTLNDVTYESGAKGEYDHSEGYKTIANSHVSSSSDYNGAAHAEGYQTQATNQAAHAEGKLSIASGASSHSEGSVTTASGHGGSHAEGHMTTASGTQGSHAEGSNTVASGAFGAHAEGYLTIASGMSSHSEGIGGSFTINNATYTSGANGNYDHSEGYQTLAKSNTSLSSSIAAHAEGYQTQATNQAAHAEGFQTIAANQGAHSEGGNTLATGYESHAEGYGTTASSDYAHAEGYQTISRSTASHAEGYTTIAGAYGSHSEGGNSSANSNYSHAEGYYTKAYGRSTHVFGEYNSYSTGSDYSSNRGPHVEIVGNGTADDARSNARTLDWSGNETLAGKLTVGAGPTANMDVATKQYVDGALSGTATTQYVDNSVSGLATTQYVDGALSGTYIPNVYYATCSTAAGTKAKVATLVTGSESFSLEAGVVLIVKFSESSGASSPTLQIGSNGEAKSICAYGSTAISATVSNGWRAGAMVLLIYDGTRWIRPYWYNTTYSIASTYCNTAAGTAAKVGACDFYTYLNPGYLQVGMGYSNTAQSALTLNVNSAGALPIYINGEPSSADNYTLPAGLYFVYCDGTNYYFRTDGKLTADITGNAATVNGKTVAENVPAGAKFTDTTYSAGSGLSLNGTTINHSNSVTGGTAGTTSATSGFSISVPYVTYDNQGHVTAGGTHTHTISMSDYAPLTDPSFTNNISVAKKVASKCSNQILVGTGVVGSTGSSTAPYVPSHWIFDAGLTPVEGDVIVIKIPCAGHASGVWVSVDNGVNYDPVAISTAGNLTTHFAEGCIIALAYEVGMSTEMYGNTEAGAPAGASETAYVHNRWKVINYYDTNTTPYGVRTYKYSSGYTGDYPIMVAKTLAANIGSSSNGSYTNNIYAMVAKDAQYVPTYNLSNGNLKSKHFIAAESISIGSTSMTEAQLQSLLGGSTVTVSGSTPSITATADTQYVCGECSTLDITLPASGDVEVIFESGSTATVLTITPPTGVTAVKWANGFDPTALNANTRYDLIITDGEWGIAAAWA